MGVGDLSVGKKMRKLGEALYGRLRSYEAAFEGADEADGLETILSRTVYEGMEAPPVSELAAYVHAQRSHLAMLPLRALLDGQVDWSAK